MKKSIKIKIFFSNIILVSYIFFLYYFFQKKSYAREEKIVYRTEIIIIDYVFS